VNSRYFLRLDHFEGPLDLLLHLIKVHEIDIFDIDIVVLSRQYLDYLRMVKFQDLNDASDFLDMAATLIEIKSRMLLPRQVFVTEDGEVIEEDPRESLQARLIEYEKYRRASEHFATSPQLGVEIQTSNEWQRLEPLYEHVEAPLIGNVATLVVLYEQMLRALVERKPSKIEAKMHLVSVEEKIEELSELLKTVRFTLFQGFYSRFKSRYEVVVYILAILELSKTGRAKVYQQELLGPLWVYRSDLDVSMLPIRPTMERLGSADAPASLEGV